MSEHHIYRFDDFVVDPDARRLCRGGQEVHLEPVVLRLLVYLVSHRDRLVTRQELMDTVWGDTVISDSALSKAVARLRKALGDDPAAPRYLETVHAQGFRFIADIEEAERSSSLAATPRRENRAGLGLGLLAAAVAVLVALAAVLWTRVTEQEVPAAGGIRSLAVLPLGNLTGDPAQESFAEGLQDILITELSQVPELRVTSRQSTKRYRDSRKPASEIARELGVDGLVEGSLLRRGEEIELTVQLIDGRSDEHLWAQRYARDAPNAYALLSEVARSIATQVDPGLAASPEPRVADSRRDRLDPRAIDAYSLGLTNLDRFTPDGIQSAIDQFQEAVAIEPKFALAWGQLAVAHAMQSLHGYSPPRESIERARAAALKAIEADDQSYIGHSTLGWVHLWTGDLDGACDSFHQALRLNPSAPYALHGEADCLMLEGRMEESVARTRDLLMVGPFSAMHNRPLPYHLFLARRFDEAIDAAEAMQARIPGFPMHWLLAQVYWSQGRLDEALVEQRRQLERRGDAALVAALDAGLETAGPSGAMLAMAEVLVDRARESHVDPFQVAETFAWAGQVDEALEWLDRAVDEGSYEIVYVAFRPDFDVLHDDARYRKLLERIYGPRAMSVGRPG